METNKNRVAIYCRLSEEDRFKTNADDDSNSIVNQKAMLVQYCTDRGWEICKIYSDDDYTGSDRNRPAFNEMLRCAEKREFDIILCKTQSRFTRELELVEKYINFLFPMWGIRFVSVVDNADTDVKANKKSRQINGLINEWYLEDMSDNIKAVLTSRRKNGFFIGAFAPYGYKKDPDCKGHLIIDDEAAEVVRLIYSLYLQGHGRTSIARELNIRHIPTPTDYKLAHGERYKNNHTATRSHQWRYFMIGKILTSETYIGNLVQNKAHSISYKTKVIKPTPKDEWIRVEGTHEPIIDMDTWNKAQRILASRAKPEFKSTFQNIFTRKVFCGLCGGGVRLSRNANGQKYFRCATKYYAPEACPGVRLNYGVLYREVLSEFQKIVKKYANVDMVSAGVMLEDTLESKTTRIKKDMAMIYSKLNEVSACMKNMYVDKIKGVIDEGAYNALSKEFSEEWANLNKELERLKHLLDETTLDISKQKDKLSIIADYMNITELNFDFVNTFIDRIVVHEKKKFSREYSFEIFWNF